MVTQRKEVLLNMKKGLLDRWRKRGFLNCWILTIRGGRGRWYVNVIWNFTLTLWVNTKYQKQTQGKLSVTRFQVCLIRWKKLNIYICLICIYTRKNDEYLHIGHSPSQGKTISYLHNRANDPISWSLVRNKWAACMKLVNFISFCDHFLMCQLS